MKASPKERFATTLSGGEADRKPLIGWPGNASDPSDAIVCDIADLNRRVDDRTESDPLLLVQVSNPFGRSLMKGSKLNTLLADAPEAGGEVLDAFVTETRQEISSALQGGADGVLYLLYGACEEHCSPMQYGGHYLERDRELLSDATGATLNLLFVVGDRDLYLDFVSDLPAHLFGWDNVTTGITAAEGRAIRGGAVASFDSGSDVLLTFPGVSAAQILEKNCLESAL